MVSKSAKIAGIGYFVPKKVLSNEDIEKMVDTSDEWITTRTGIKERRMASSDETTADLAVKAAKSALKDAKMAAEDIDLIIVATMTPDHFMPSTATIVQHKLKAKKAAAFDVAAACSGFVYAMTVAHQFIANGFYKNALIIGAETVTKFIDFTDRNTCVLFGDGAGAVVLKSCKAGSGILGSYIKSDGKNFITIPAGGSKQPCSKETLKNRQHYIKMDGLEVFKFGVKVVPDAVRHLLKKCKLKIDDVDNIIFHQANVRIVDAVCAKLKIDKEKSFVNLHKYGNTSAASIPIALCEAIKKKAVKKGDTIVLVGFGAGMTWGATALKL
jgi:3-oxoacyl-[acyl-carrier-protein] synthase-3